MDRKKRSRLNNRGSALVSVLVVTVFISIIATTMLYVSAQNYQMKYTDYQNKQSFYGAEKALDSFKALLVADVEDAHLEAYQEVMKNYNTSAQERQKCYQETYLEKLEEIWGGRLTAGAAPEQMAEELQNFMIANGVDAEVAQRIYKVDGYAVISTASSVSTIGKQFVLIGVRSKYTSGNYTTFLYTDIGFSLPELDLSADSYLSVSPGSSSDRDLIALTDYVVYMNWRKADYDE